MSNADVLFHNGPILKDSGPEGFLKDGILSIKGDTIARVCSPDQANPAEINAAEKVDLKGRLLMPGLINAHTHAAMTLFRGLADDLPLMTWLEEFIFPAEKKLRDEWVYWGTKLACAEMISTGTTGFCDMYLFEDAAARATDEAGLRALLGEAFYDFPSPNYGPPEKGLEYIRELITNWAHHERISIAAAPHALYTCSPELLQKCRQISREYGIRIFTHVAETEHEVRQIKERYNTSPVRHLENLGLLNERLVVDHVIHVGEREIDLLAENHVSAVHCPESNMKLASGTAPVSRMTERGVTVALGTDGCASNNDLDMFQEMDSAAKLQKLAQMDPTAMPADAVVRMATINGAEALGWGEITGSLEPGKKADMIVVDFNRPHLVPVYDYCSHLTYAVNGADVTETMVDGKWLMRDKTLLSLDVAEITRQVMTIAEEIRSLP